MKKSFKIILTLFLSIGFVVSFTYISDFNEKQEKINTEAALYQYEAFNKYITYLKSDKKSQSGRKNLIACDIKNYKNRLIALKKAESIYSDMKLTLGELQEFADLAFELQRIEHAKINDSKVNLVKAQINHNLSNI